MACPDCILLERRVRELERRLERFDLPGDPAEREAWAERMTANVLRELRGDVA